MITPNENQMVIIDSNQKDHLVEILFELSDDEISQRGIERLPSNLYNAIKAFK